MAKTYEMDKAIAEMNREFAEYAKTRLPEEVWQAQKLIAIELFKRIIFRTPVDTGRARGGWQMTVEYPSATEDLPADTSGAGTLQAGIQNLSGLGAYGVVWINNNVVYIEPLEKGHSKQASAGMVVVSIREMMAIFK